MKKILVILSCLALFGLFGCSTPNNPNTEILTPDENGIYEIKAMPFSKLQSYNFEADKKYRVHLNQDCMDKTGNMGSPLPELLSSKPNIIEIVIDEGVTSIPDSTFNSCDKLTKVKIAESITSIGNNAFSYCRNLKDITIPKNVSSIGTSAFFENDNLEEIIVDNDNTNYIAKEGILYSKTPSVLIICPNQKTGSVEIPEDVTEIASDALYRCKNLTEVTIPFSVNKIGSRALGYSGLKTINYRGTMEQWNTIVGYSYPPVGCIVKCTNGDITIKY